MSSDIPDTALIINAINTQSRRVTDMGTSLKSSIDDVKSQVAEARQEAREDNKEIWEEINEGKKEAKDLELKVEKMNGRVHSLEETKEETKARNEQIQNHISWKDGHFDKTKAATTRKEYLAKKELLLAVVGLITVTVSALTAWVANGMPGIGP